MEVSEAAPESGPPPAAPISAPAIDIRRSLFSSFNAQTIAIVLRIAQQLILVPALIAGWGAALSQDWILISSAAGLFSMLDCGAQIYYSNALAIAWSKGDTGAFRRLFGTAMSVYLVLVLAAVGALLALTALGSWSTLLGTRTMSTARISWTLVLMVVSTIGLLPIGVVGTVYRVHGNYFHGTMLVVSAEAARGFGICAVALCGAGPVSGGVLNVIVSALLWVAMLADLRKRYGGIPFSLVCPGVGELKAALAGSALYFVPSTATPVVLNLPILLLGRLAPDAHAVFAYAVLRTLTGFVRQFVLQMCHPIGSELARQQVLGDDRKQRRLFVAAGRLTAGMGGILGGVTLVLAKPFLLIWTHAAVVYDPPLLLAFLITSILLAPAQVAMVLFLYSNRPMILVAGNAGYAIGTVVFCSLLIPGHSATGAAVATGLAEFLFIGVLVTIMAAREVRIAPAAWLGRCYLVATAAFGVSYGVAWGLASAIKAASLASLVVVGGGWAIVAAVPAFFLLLSVDERAWMISLALPYGQRVLRWVRRQAEPPS